MGYWVFLLFLLIMATVLSICLYKVKKEDDDSIVGMGMFVCCMLGLALIGLIIDIPSALAGGEKIYVDKFPKVVQMQGVHLVSINEHDLISFRGYNPDKYEKEAWYCISYTKYTKSVLDIEKVE